MSNTTQRSKNAAMTRTAGESHEIDPGEAFEMLQSPRRRAVIEALDRDPEWTLSDLAEHVAAVENDCARESLESQQRKRVYVALYQTHLDKLDDAGVLAFDGDRIEAIPEVVTAYCRILECAREQPVGDEQDDRDDSGFFAQCWEGILR